ncbi:MEAK7-like protein, partial [Mya arenaria]
KDSIASTFQSFLPVITNVDWSSTYTILDIVSISYLNHHIPRQHQATWRLLYSNSIHGDSFSQLTRFMVGKGPTVMIVKDKDGHVFGGYVSESWEIRPNFYGDSTCFLFTLKPRLGVYMATGYNENFGFGGQLNYFGMWIDYSFNSGHSKAKPKCTTYGSPQLSGSPEFVVDHLEVWAVGPEKKKNDSDDEDDAKTSILDKDSGAKAILELAGRKHHSEGLRELREDEEMTDEMKRKMNTIPKLL